MSIGDETEEVRKEILKIAGSYSAPIFWADSNKVLNNGTAFILDTGESTFVVTAAHVFEGYIKAKEERKTTNCQLSNIEFDLEERRISNNESESMDIATFSITEQEIELLDISVLHGSQESWPPARPNEGEAVVVAGYPGIERIEEKKQECNFSLHCFNTPASSVSERHIGCSFERQYWVDLFGSSATYLGVRLKTRDVI